MAGTLLSTITVLYINSDTKAQRHRGRSGESGGLKGLNDNHKTVHLQPDIDRCLHPVLSVICNLEFDPFTIITPSPLAVALQYKG